MPEITIKKISEKEYEVKTTAQKTETELVNIDSLKSEILELEEKKTKTETELQKKKELLKALEKVK